MVVRAGHGGSPGYAVGCVGDIYWSWERQAMSVKRERQQPEVEEQLAWHKPGLPKRPDVRGDGDTRVRSDGVRWKKEGGVQVSLVPHRPMVESLIEYDSDRWRSSSSEEKALDPTRAAYPRSTVRFPS